MNSSSALQSAGLKDLRALARQEGINGYTRLKKEELIGLLSQIQTQKEGVVQGIGYLDIAKDGKGFLRGRTLMQTDGDVYVSPSQIKRFGLRSGDLVEGPARQPRDGEKYRSLLKLDAVNSLDPDQVVERPRFETLTPVYPDQQYILETRPHIMATRLIDLISPIGRGQRGLIVSPPKSGATTILKQIANGLTDNYRGLNLLLLLVGERPEEVTDMRRSVDATVVSTLFDDPPAEQISVAELVLAHAIRLVELKKDVVLMLSSLTQLARAYNTNTPLIGRLPSGALDPAALHPAKQFLGAARKLEGSGSLTIIATCLTGTDSRVDEAIYDDFKGAPNMQLQLDRSLAERRIFPAIDIEHSFTRREELLLDSNTLQQVWTLRRMVEALRVSQPGTEPMTAIRERLRRTRDNREFLASLNHREGGHN